MSTTLGQVRDDTTLEPAYDAPPDRRDTRRGWWWLVLISGLAGILSGIIQIHDRIAWASGTKGSDAICEFNAVISCSGVYPFWQSAVFGVTNSAIGMPIFALIASAGLAGLLGSQLSRGYLATIWGLSIFLALFITWYMSQMAYSIGSLCIYCTACMVAIIGTSIGMTRVADDGLALGTGRAGRTLRSFTHGRTDLIIFGGWLLIVAAMIYTGLFL